MRPDAQFDYDVKRVIEANFPLEVVVDENNKTGYFRITNAFPPMAGLVFRYQNASYDDVANHLSFGYEILSNPKNIDVNHPTLKNLLFHTLQIILGVESQYILSKGHNE